MNYWLGFDPASCFPDKCQCEAVRDALIRQPSAFWSSFAYIVSAIAIYKTVKSKTFTLRLWTGACVLLGLSSIIGHGSFTRFSMAMDFSSIVLILTFFMMMKVLKNKTNSNILFIMSGYYMGLVVAMYSLDKWTKMGSCLVLFGGSFVDVTRSSSVNLLKVKELRNGLILLLLSFILFAMDEAHINCNPDSLIQYHSLWHIGTAFAIYLYGKWRFAEMRDL